MAGFGFTARVQRGSSETARCASTKPSPAVSPSHCNSYRYSSTIVFANNFSHMAFTCGIGFRLIRFIHIHFHVLPDSHIARILEPQRIERMLNRLPLRIENPLLQSSHESWLSLSLLTCERISPMPNRASLCSLPDQALGCLSIYLLIHKIPAIVPSPPKQAPPSANASVNHPSDRPIQPPAPWTRKSAPPTHNS